jgi:hypothetical protein
MPHKFGCKIDIYETKLSEQNVSQKSGQSSRCVDTDLALGGGGSGRRIASSRPAGGT